MFRIVAVLYLMIVTAAGPAACCCTLERLMTRFAPSASTSAPAAPPCCHNRQAGQDSKDSSGLPSPSNRKDRPGCPCRESGERDVAALPGAGDEVRQSVARVFTPFDVFHALPLDHFASSDPVSSAFRNGVMAPPVSTDDLLYACHILRC